MSRFIELRDKYNENVARLNELEVQERNEAEEKEYRSLKAENAKIFRELEQNKVAEMANGQKENAPRLETEIRESIASGKQFEIAITRSNDPTGGMGGTGAKLNMMADVASSGLIPVTTKAITEVIEEGTIFNLLPGISIESGLVGNVVYPIVDSVAATVVGEGVKLGDTELDLTSVTAKPERIGVAVPITRECINKTDGMAENIATQLLPKAVSKLINKIMFSTSKVTNAVNLYSPFQPLAASGFRKLGTAPAFADMNALKADLLGEGVSGDNIAWVMSPANYAALEVTPKDSGSGIMVAEDGKVCGVPVFVTSEIGDTFIGIGDFSYCPVGFHGDMNLIADPYSRARANTVDIVLNANVSITILQQKAFKLGKLVAKS